MQNANYIISNKDIILITGANGFIGSRVVEALLGYGFKNLRCFVRPSANLTKLNKIISSFNKAKIELFKGNLLSSDSCKKAIKDVAVIFHLAAGTEKSFPGCFLNSVVTTKNLLDATLQEKNIKRVLNVSSFAVYSGINIKRGGLLTEKSEVEAKSHLRFEAYTYGKVKQDEILLEYNKKYNIPFVIVRPGVVYGSGKSRILGRVGIDTFGIFLHLGGSNIFPLTYVENCADAIVLAGLKKNIDGEIFNIVDDDLPTCRKFLKLYKKNVNKFRSIFLPYPLFYLFCYLWEKYSNWSEGQLPPAFNRLRCAAGWKGSRYSNQKLKDLLGWKPKISFEEASKRYFEYLKNEEFE